MKKILIDADKNDEVRVAIVEGEGLIDYEAERVKNDRTKGNIYPVSYTHLTLPTKA